MTSPSTTRSPRPARRPRVAALLAGLCVLALVGCGVLAFWLSGQSSDISAREKDELEVRAAAQQFTETWNTFSSDDAQGYVDEVAPLLSTKFRAEFTDAATDVVTGIEQQRLSSKGAVLTDGDDLALVGIASLDPDSADVLVVSDAKRTSNGQDVLRHWRWEIHLVKVDGDWLVDGFDAL